MRYVGALVLVGMLGCGDVSSNADPQKSGAAGAGGRGGELATSSGGQAGDGRQAGASGSAPAAGGTTATGGAAGETTDGGVWATCPHVNSVGYFATPHCLQGCEGSDFSLIKGPCELSDVDAANFKPYVAPLYCVGDKPPLPSVCN